MWSEGDNFDLALSFQEKAGCDEIWEKICQVLTGLMIGLLLVLFLIAFLLLLVFGENLGSR